MAVSSESVLAVVLSPKRVSAAEVRFVNEELEVSALGDIPSPAGAFEGAQIANGEALGRALAEFIAQRRIAARKAMMVLPEGASITQLMKLPPMPHEDMLGAVRSAAERYAVFAEHAVSADCAVVEETEEDGSPRSSVLLAACRTGNVERCQEAARGAGLELASVEAPAVVAARALREQYGGTEVVALAVVGEFKTDVMIFDGGVVRLCYSANAGLPQEMEQGDWMSPARGQFDPFTPPPQLYSELSHCFRFFQNQFPARAVERLIFTMDHPKADLIASHLGEQLQLPVELGRLSGQVRLPAEIDERIAGVTRGLTLALFRGGALSAAGQAEIPFPINLLPPTSAAWAPARRAAKVAAGAMACVLLGSMVWGLSLGRRISLEGRQLTSVRGQVAALEPQLEMLRATRARELALKSGVERETARIAKERAVRWSQILVDVAQRLPRDMWLTQLASPDDERVSLVGIAINRETIPAAIESLSGSPYLRNVVLGALTKDDVYAPGRTVIRYQINADLLRGALSGYPAPAVASVQLQEVGR